jgi:hypothetical protein
MQSRIVFSVFEAFSFLLDDGNGCVVSQKTMKASINACKEGEMKMGDNRRPIQRIYEEFVKFERTMEELRFLKLVAQDLRSFKKMIKLKKYD